MGYLFAGNELDAFVRSSVNVAEQSSGGTFDATYVRGSIKVGANTPADYIETPQPLGSQTTIWLHFEWYHPTSFSALAIASLYNASGTVVFKLTPDTSGNVQCAYWNGSTYTNIGATFAVPANTRVAVDLKLVCGGSGSVTAYLDSVLKMTASASMGSVDNVDKVRINCANNTGFSGRDPLISQVIISITSTILHKFYCKPPTGNSATNTAFTGDFNAVDELILDDTDYIESTAANDVETYTHAAITFPTTGSVKAVVVSARALVAATGPQNLQACLRVGGTNYFSGNLSGLGAGFAPVQAIFANDPSTSAAWGTTNAGSATTESGLKSIT
jgi:hypothetical protein